MKTLLLLFLLFFASCKNNNSNIVENFPKDQNLERKEYAGNMFGNKEGIIIFEDKDTISSKNITLWKKSVQVISNILPISIINQDSGLISTDWGNIKKISGNDDFYKINVIVSGEKINTENLKVSVFKKNKNGESISDNAIKDKIINLITDSK